MVDRRRLHHENGISDLASYWSMSTQIICKGTEDSMADIKLKSTVSGENRLALGFHR